MLKRIVEFTICVLIGGVCGVVAWGFLIILIHELRRLLSDNSN